MGNWESEKFKTFTGVITTIFIRYSAMHQYKLCRIQLVKDFLQSASLAYNSIVTDKKFWMARTEITKKELKRITKILSCQSTVNFLFCPFAWNAISAALHSGMLNLNNQISLLIIAIMCTFHLTSFHIKKIISTLLIFIVLTALSTLLVNWTRVFFSFQ